jgi:hypothetical protein
MKIEINGYFKEYHWVISPYDGIGSGTSWDNGDGSGGGSEDSYFFKRMLRQSETYEEDIWVLFLL